LVSPLLKFISDLYVIESDVLRTKDSLIVFSDFKIEWNPEFSNTKITHNKDLTLAEMQQERLQNQQFVWNKGLFKVNGEKKKKVTGSESLNLQEIISHFQSLRAVGYSIINNL
jgi:hypothetical protein